MLHANGVTDIQTSAPWLDRNRCLGGGSRGDARHLLTGASVYAEAPGTCAKRSGLFERRQVHVSANRRECDRDDGGLRWVED